MKDIYRRLAKKSIKDAAYLQEDVAEEYEVAMPPQAVGQFALALYNHRVQAHRRKVMKAEQDAMYPDTEPEPGRF